MSEIKNLVESIRINLSEGKVVWKRGKLGDIKDDGVRNFVDMISKYAAKSSELEVEARLDSMGSYDSATWVQVTSRKTGNKFSVSVSKDLKHKQVNLRFMTPGGSKKSLWGDKHGAADVKATVDEYIKVIKTEK